MLFVALAIAISIPILTLYAIFKADHFRTRELNKVLISFISGLAAYGLAILVNRGVMNFLPYNLVTRFTAPVAEEILKGAVLVVLAFMVSFTYFVDGAIYGFAAGIAFAVIENGQYIIQNPSAALTLAIARVLSTNLVHASGSSLIGIGWGKARFESGWRRIFTGLGFTLLAIILHSVFNNLVTSIKGAAILLIAIPIGLLAAGVIYWLIRRGLAEEKGFIKESLGDADRVTGSEVAMVQGLDKAKKLLAPIYAKFGRTIGDNAEAFLILQAKLGILRNTLGKLPDEKMRKSVEQQMARSRKEMDALRRKVGAYAMMYLRSIYLEDKDPLFTRLDSLVKERLAAQPEGIDPAVWNNLILNKIPAASGKNLWASLQQRSSTAENTPKQGEH
jgi:RsiW-degrading membrane proteinase PrsW (M82 family)